MSQITIRVQLAFANLRRAQQIHCALDERATEDGDVREVIGLCEAANATIDELQVRRRTVVFVIEGPTSLPVVETLAALRGLGAKAALFEVDDDQTGAADAIALFNGRSCSVTEARRQMALARKVRGKSKASKARSTTRSSGPAPAPAVVDLADYADGEYELAPAWPSIAKTLRALARSAYVPGLKSADVKRHRELYDRLQETAPARWPDGALTDENQYQGDLALLVMQYVFWLWYHPAPESVDMKALRNYVRDLHGVPWDTLFDAFPKAIWDGGPPRLAPGYGMMGGREKRIVSLLCPRQEYPLERSSGHVLSVGLLLAAFCRGVRQEMNNTFAWYPFHPGQYVFDRIVDACDYLPDIIPPKGAGGWTADTTRNSFVTALREVQRFEEFDGPSRWRPSTIELATHVRRRCESPEAPEQLQDYWAQADARVREERREGVPAQKDPKWLLLTMGSSAPKLSDEDLARIYAGWPQVRR